MSYICLRSSSSLAPPFASPPDHVLNPSHIAITPARPSDYWAIAQAHQQVFYPDTDLLRVPSFRWDRVVAMRNGQQCMREGKGNSTCLMARDTRYTDSAPQLPIALPLPVEDLVQYGSAFVPDEIREAVGGCDKGLLG